MVLSQAEKLLNIENLDSVSPNRSLGTTVKNTSEGGSCFTPGRLLTGEAAPRHRSAPTPFPLDSTGASSS